MNQPILLNFSHPLTPRQLQEIEVRTGCSFTQRQIPVHVPNGHSLADTARAVLDSVALSGDEWQTSPLLIVVPGLAPLTACLMAELHGRCGYFPTIIVVRPDHEGSAGTFRVTEIVNLSTVRTDARQRRFH
jgi:hypothetical protein